jgi:hypothetical protein
MVHLRHDLSLALETLFDLRSELGRGEQLDGDLAVQEGIARSVNDPHAAATELGCDLVAVAELRRAEHQFAPVGLGFRGIRESISFAIRQKKGAGKGALGTRARAPGFFS